MCWRPWRLQTAQRRRSAPAGVTISSGNTQPLLRDAMCLSILQSRDAALPLLEELAARLAKQPTAWASSTGR